MSTNQSIVPTAIGKTIEILTHPLLLVYAPARVLSLQILLQTALSDIFAQKRRRLTITISGGVVAPRALHPGCIATAVAWAEWFRVLGGRDFDLIVEETSVSARINGLKRVIWTDPAVTTIAPTAIRQTLQATLNSAIARTRSRTAAQLILSSPDEEKEADALLSCISTASIVSPTPTRDTFPPIACVPAGLSSIPEAYSRPSSRTSESSDSSCFSAVSAASSATSISSGSPTKYTAPSFVARSVSTIRVLENEEAAGVIVNTSKKDITKYLYHGGVSTVLTGGVMLGTPKPTFSSSPALKHRQFSGTVPYPSP